MRTPGRRVAIVVIVVTSLLSLGGGAPATAHHSGKHIFLPGAATGGWCRFASNFPGDTFQQSDTGLDHTAFVHPAPGSSCP
jgi:hypothetical protein